MNLELIQRLYSEAVDITTILSKGLPYPKAWTFEKVFTELIVKECADIALKSGSVSNKSEVAVAEADRIYHKIQEHFGVEE